MKIIGLAVCCIGLIGVCHGVVVAATTDPLPGLSATRDRLVELQRRLGELKTTLEHPAPVPDSAETVFNRLMVRLSIPNEKPLSVFNRRPGETEDDFRCYIIVLMQALASCKLFRRTMSDGVALEGTAADDIECLRVAVGGNEEKHKSVFGVNVRGDSDEFFYRLCSELPFVNDIVQGSKRNIEHYSSEVAVLSGSPCEQFGPLVLGVPKSGTTLQDLLLDDTNPKPLPTGSRKALGGILSESTKLFHMPNILVIALHRTGIEGGKKVLTAVAVPAELNFRNDPLRACLLSSVVADVDGAATGGHYRLRAACLHDGEYRNGGHWTALVQKQVDGVQRWYRCNDAIIEQDTTMATPDALPRVLAEGIDRMSGAAVIGRPYEMPGLLFYERIGT